MSAGRFPITPRLTCRTQTCSTASVGNRDTPRLGRLQRRSAARGRAAFRPFCSGPKRRPDAAFVPGAQWLSGSGGFSEKRAATLVPGAFRGRRQPRARGVHHAHARAHEGSRHYGRRITPDRARWQLASTQRALLFLRRGRRRLGPDHRGLSRSTGVDRGSAGARARCRKTGCRSNLARRARRDRRDRRNRHPRPRPRREPPHQASRPRSAPSSWRLFTSCLGRRSAARYSPMSRRQRRLGSRPRCDSR